MTGDEDEISPMTSAANKYGGAIHGERRRRYIHIHGSTSCFQYVSESLFHLFIGLTNCTIAEVV